MPSLSASTRKRKAASYSHERVGFVSEAESLSASIEKLYKRPANKAVVKHKFTDEAKAALLQALQQHSWTTAREAYGWVWNVQGLHVNYLTVWRFLTAQGLLAGDTPRARRLAPRPQA